MEYVRSEVRKGGITNYFSNEIGIENCLHGSNKSEQNFEFSRGHRKLLMVIVKLVKQNFDENGLDAFIAEIPKPKENKNLDAVRKSQKETKDVSVSTEISTLGITETDSKVLFHENLINLQAKLLKQTVRSLFIHSSAMYEEVSIHNYNCSSDNFYVI